MTKEKLFELYSTNLELVCPQYKNVFVCPLCLRVFARESICAKTLSAEHIVPSVSDAKWNLTLTCQKCNNDTGSDLDAHLRRYIQSEENLLKKGGPIRGKMFVGSKQSNVELYLQPDSSPQIIAAELRKYRSSAEQQKAVERYIQTKAFEFEWRPNYDSARFKTALLRSAYLLMFSCFGYSYIFDENCERIRKQIFSFRNGDTCDEVLLKGILDQAGHSTQHGVNVVSSPKNLRSFFVTLKVSKKIEYSFGVILPGLGSNAINVYDRLPKGTSVGQLQCLTFPFNEDVFTDPDLTHIVRLLWHEIDNIK